MDERRASAWSAVAIAALVLIATGGILSLHGNLAWGSDTATVRIGSDPSVPPGGSTTVPLEILGAPAPGVGAATVDIMYDPSVVDPTGWSGGPGFDMAQCSPDYERDGVNPDTVRCTAISAAGVSGDSLLADITFQCIGGGGRCSNLDVSVVTFTDPDGNPISVTDEDGQICCGGGPPTITATRTPTLTPTPPDTPVVPTPSPPEPTPPPGGMHSVALVPGCNPVTTTYPDNTPIATITAAVTPEGTLQSIWQFEAGIWLGYSPLYPLVSNLTETDRLAVVFICVGAPSSFVRPVL